MVVTIDRMIVAPPWLVFELYVDPERMREWQPALRQVTAASGRLDTPGASYVLDQPGPRLQINVQAVDRPHLHEQRASFRWFGWVLTARFLPAGNGTRLLFEYRYGHGPPWLWRLLMPRLASAFGRAELDRLKQVAELEALGREASG